MRRGADQEWQVARRITVRQIEREHRELVLLSGARSRLKAPEVRRAVASAKIERSIDHRRSAPNACQRFRQAREALGPPVPAPAVESHRAAALEDLQAVTAPEPTAFT